MTEDKKFQYAIPCIFSKQAFFVKFTTESKEEAIKLASCIYGKKAIEHLVRIDEDGKVTKIP